MGGVAYENMDLPKDPQKERGLHTQNVLLAREQGTLNELDMCWPNRGAI